MTSPVIICCVKALYDFQSTDPSSLTFKKDDEIDVLAQLESGWWDGWCNGERGWFPCNYVQVVEVQGSGEDSDEPEKETDEEDDEEEEEEEEEDELDAAQDGRLAQRIAAEDPWIPQTTPDGIIFYFNTQTRVSSWDVPLDDKELLELQAAGERDEAARRANTATPDAASGASSSRGSFPTSASSDRASTPRASTPRASTPRAGSPSQERVRCGSKTNGSGKANGTANGNGHHRYSRQQANGSPAPGAGLPVDWVLQQTEDGIGHYYYNTVTEEMRWEHPLDRAESRIDTFMDSVSISDDDVSDEIDEAEKEKEVMEEWSKRDEDAAEESETEDANSARRRSQPSGGFADNESHNEERKSFASSSGSRLGDSVPGAPQKEINAQLGDDIENGEKLPPNWVKKNTAQGRPYYYNVVTQEKTWTLENVDMETGEIVSV
ncbi:hypothetical protein BC936DRAFT_143658 [Jimgerdemannia flammicorona]|uniref:WW domain-containing protein n=1 Tax=Jimgerdemannia flammicorona TaxID=994334 RepID=A0A432ZYM0_9FUNG|nr:hypothetical protein BC936DRAFT_143658 [Jimgerdemannia flammicorona]